MRRRDLLTGGTAAISALALPRGLRAQQIPVIGFLHSGTAEQNANRLAGFRKGLSETGFAEGRNVTIEYRWADGQADRLPDLASDLVRRRVAVIVTLSSQPATLAARAATTSIPIVFTWPGDPVEAGLVASIKQPGGNATGITTLNDALAAKRLGLIRELAPKATPVFVLLNPGDPTAAKNADELQALGRSLGVTLTPVWAGSEREIDAAFASIGAKPGSALVVNPDPFIFIRRAQITALAARHAVPAIYYDREFAMSGGLITYGTDLPSAWGQGGGYVARILKGEKPSELPVAQPTKFQLVINLKTARALALDVPQNLLSLADEVIE